MQITKITGGGPSSNTVKTMFISNTNAVKGAVAARPVNQNLSTMVTGMNPRIAATVRGANRVRVQSATVSSGIFSTTTTTGGGLNPAGVNLDLSTRLNDLYDVELGIAGDVADGSFLVYNSATDYWTFTSEISGGTF